MIFKTHRNISWALVDQAMVSGVNFFTGILFARFLGIEEFGRFTLVWMAILFTNSIQMTMISAPMMSIGPKQKKGYESQYYGAVFMHQFFFGGLTFLLLWGGVKLTNCFYQEWNVNHLALPLATVGFFFQTQDFLRRFFFSIGRQTAAFINDAISYLGQLSLLIIFFYWGSLSTNSVLWIIALTSAVAVVIGLLTNGKINRSKKAFFQVASRHYHFSKWMLASTLLQWTSSNLFIIAAGSILGTASVGAIKASQNIMAISHILFQGMENFVPIQASRILQSFGYSAMYAYLKKVITYGGVMTAMIGLIAACAPTFWLKLLYGVEYIEYGYVLQWFSIIYLLMFIPFPLRAGLRALERTKKIFVSNVLCSIFTIGSASLLINKYQIVGFLFGLFFVYLLNSIYLFYSLKTIQD